MVFTCIRAIDTIPRPELSAHTCTTLPRSANAGVATCLAYWWIIYLGTLASEPHWRRMVHCADRCDLSFFQLGLRLLRFWLEADVPLGIAFLPLASRAQTFILSSVRY